MAPLLVLEALGFGALIGLALGALGSGRLNPHRAPPCPSWCSPWACPYKQQQAGAESERVRLYTGMESAEQAAFMTKRIQTWEVYYPDAAATGLPFARCRIDPTDVLWLHSSPERLAVTVRDGDEAVVARGEPLERRGDKYPMTRLSLREGTIHREDRWPTAGDLGELVLLPGGEAGHLRAWWNAQDGSEWRWQVEFYNHR